jgi:hypothetical protein
MPTLRERRPPELVLPEVLAKMPPKKFEAGMRALMKIAMEIGAAKLAANPGLGKRQ